MKKQRSVLKFYEKLYNNKNNMTIELIPNPKQLKKKPDYRRIVKIKKRTTKPKRK
jgi:hypothetical protein